MKKIKHLEGLRGVAAFIVVLNHLRNTCFITEYDRLQKIISSSHLPGIVKKFLINSTDMLVDGNLSVWVFWLLSSYVISIAFFKPGQEYDKVVVSYAAKRYFRLFVPVLAATLVAYLLMKAGFMYNQALAAKAGAPYSNGWLTNFYALTPNFFKALWAAFFETFLNFETKSTYNAVLWTIEREFLGSLFTFSIFGIVRHNKKRHLLYMALLAAVYALEMYWLCCFIAGHVLCDYDCTRPQLLSKAKLQRCKNLLHRLRYAAAPAGILLIIFGRTILPALHIPVAVHNLLLSFIIVWCVLRIHAFSRLFAAALPFWLGRVSFSLYLVHLPVICSLTSFMLLHNFTVAGKLVACFTTIIVSLILALYFTIYVDANGVKLASKIGDYFKRNTG
jgi:peptidoglycan/LPS O-acetylase OafA/YrhL